MLGPFVTICDCAVERRETALGIGGVRFPGSFEDAEVAGPCGDVGDEDVFGGILQTPYGPAREVIIEEVADPRSRGFFLSTAVCSRQVGEHFQSKDTALKAGIEHKPCDHAASCVSIELAQPSAQPLMRCR